LQTLSATATTTARYVAAVEVPIVKSSIQEKTIPGDCGSRKNYAGNLCGGGVQPPGVGPYDANSSLRKTISRSAGSISAALQSAGKVADDILVEKIEVESLH